MYSKNGENDDKMITGYSDADWAGDANDRKSTSGYLFMVSGLEKQETDLCCTFYRRS